MERRPAVRAAADGASACTAAIAACSVYAADSAALGQPSFKVYMMRADFGARLPDLIRQLESDAQSGGAHRDAQIGADADVLARLAHPVSNIPATMMTSSSTRFMERLLLR